MSRLPPELGWEASPQHLIGGRGRWCSATPTRAFEEVYMTVPPRDVLPKVRRLALIGLDCGTPELLFERFADDMPTLTKLREQALWGPLRSIDPPISIPAWICMLSGRTPGDLGVYGMRNRSDHSYKGMAFATSKTFAAPRLWEL